uniref:Jacalin-type lectin domain-containing protein n=1 Tax=Hucho hucho TaxID=62062 RepID=A0A4W5QE39_9TELE
LSSLHCLSVLLASCLAMSMKEPYSYSSAVVQGGGTPFASSGEGRITGVRVWENINYYYYYYCYYYNSNTYTGDGAIVQVSGKYNPRNYIYTLVFTTNRGHSLLSGQPKHVSFNFYPAHMGNELRLLSGCFNGAGITSIGVHWGLVNMEGDGNSTGNSTSY